MQTLKKMKKEITFDTAVRGLMILAGFVLAILLIRRLESVLLPFFVAWLLAYLVYPVVTFFQYRCHLRYRLPSIIVALLLVFSALVGLLALVVPPTIRELSHLQGILVGLIREWGQSPLATEVERYLHENLDERTITQLLQNKSVVDVIQLGFTQTWAVVTNAFNFLQGLVTFLLMLLYLFFILMDYEVVSDGFVKLVPHQQRGMASNVLEDVKNGMNNYFRGQALIAFIVGVLFSIGFSIIGLPMAVGLGMFIGVLNLVPYLQTVGILPAVLLVILRTTQTGENFWLLLLYCFVVFLVVQGIQDIILTPRIMGKVMGLRPAVILLSLSVWGSLLGFIGLIIALPLTTLLSSYYRRYVLKDPVVSAVPDAEKTVES